MNDRTIHGNTDSAFDRNYTRDGSKRLIPYDWLKIDSALIKKVKYVPDAKAERNGVVYVSPELHIEYASGKVYKFKDVPSNKVEKMMHSSSSGSYFMKEIRGDHDSEEVK